MARILPARARLRREPRNHFYPRDLACARPCTGRNLSLAALERLYSRVRRTPEKANRAGGREGARRQAQYRDHQQQRSAGAHHIGDSIRLGPDIICGLNNWPQLSAESVANVDKIVRRSVRRRKAASTRSRGSSPKTARSGSSWRSGPRPCDRASGARRPDQHVRRLNTNTEDPCKPARQPDPG